MVIANQNQSLELSNDEMRSQSSPQFGQSFPFEFLNCGDVVVWVKSTMGLFLLAPNLNSRWSSKVTEDKKWTHFIRKAELFFEKRDVHPIQTPFLVSSPGVDHHIEFFEAKGSHTKRSWFLPTSPEIHLKKALCEGWEHIYEIKTCFRDDLPGPQHQSEFKMLEWYRSYFSLEDLQTEVFDFMDHMIGEKQKRVVMTVADSFKKWVKVDLKAETTRGELLEWIQMWQLDFNEDDDWDDLFFRLYMEKIEPELGRDGITVLRQFPRSQASLAQINSQGWADRFEVYWQGVELGNAYKEVNDPAENRRRFQAESKKRDSKNVKNSPFDEEFFSKLSYGMAPASGIAFGFSRFYNLLKDESGTS